MKVNAVTLLAIERAGLKPPAQYMKASSRLN
jgi:hypothetical protein